MPLPIICLDARLRHPFHSKVDLMERLIHSCEPVADTHMHVLVDAWSSAKHIWRAARQRGRDLTSGLKSHHPLRVADTGRVYHQPEGG